MYVLLSVLTCLQCFIAAEDVLCMQTPVASKLG
jgi:hypothetical protein